MSCEQKKMITFKELLSLKTDLLETAPVKFVRHKDSRQEYRELIKDRDQLLTYQKEQGKHVFKDCDYIISFFGQEGTKSLFIGIYQVKGYVIENEKYYYDLEELDGFEDLKDRVVVDWGKAAISWHQWAYKHDKEVLEILPKGYLGEFPGLLNFILDFNELKKLSINIDANKDWYHQLSSVNGIYLILDTKKGNQYIGSAYGREGIWQRWQEYAKTGHGGNLLLKQLCDSENEYYKNFQFTVLQTLPSNITGKEVIEIENLYKQKLGSKLFGLNAN